MAGNSRALLAFLNAAIRQDAVRTAIHDGDIDKAFRLAGLRKPTEEQKKAIKGLNFKELQSLAKSFGFPIHFN